MVRDSVPRDELEKERKAHKSVARILHYRTTTVAKQIDEIDDLTNKVSKLMGLLHEVKNYGEFLPVDLREKVRAVTEGDF